MSRRDLPLRAPGIAGTGKGRQERAAWTETRTEVGEDGRNGGDSEAEHGQVARSSTTRTRRSAQIAALQHDAPRSQTVLLQLADVS